MDIPPHPLIPGLTFRLFQGESDYAALAAVLTASETADQMERSLTAADVASAYLHLHNCDPFQDLLIAEVDGKMVGYTRGWWEEAGGLSRRYHHNGFLVPEWQRKGIGRALLSRMEARLRQIAALAPAGGSGSFQASVSQFQPGAAALLERAGYQPARYFHTMVRPSLEAIPEFPLPAGLEVRPASPDQFPAIWRSVIEASRDEWGFTEPTEADYQAWLSGPDFQPELWQIAWETASDRAVGHVLTYINNAENQQFGRKRGYTEGIGVDRSWRRRGVARALISRSLQAQKAAGMEESALVADCDSTSNVIQLYESCGFQIVKRDTLYRKPLDL